MSLTNRSKITVRYTTNPGDMGYDQSPSTWQTDSGEVMGVRRAANFPQELNDRVGGQGIFRRVSYTCKGVPVSHDEIWLQSVMMDFK